jgi:hypothetical protein
MFRNKRKAGVSLPKLWYAAMLITFGCWGTTARATVVLDQSYIPAPQFTGVTGFDDGDYVAQTFTVGVGGVLDHVDVLMRQSPGAGNLTLDIRPTSNGVPVENDALALFVGQINGALIPVFPPNNTFAWVTLDVSSANIIVTPGEQLAITARTAAGQSFGWAVSGVPVYAGGDAYVRPLGFSWELTGEPSNVDYDYGFKTYVNTPEPSTLGLAVFAGVLLTLSRRRVVRSIASTIEAVKQDQ